MLRGSGWKVPPGVLFECFGEPGSECPKECFLSAFWRFWGQKALFGALGGRCPKTLKKHSGGALSARAPEHSCKWRLGSQNNPEVLRKFRRLPRKFPRLPRRSAPVSDSPKFSLIESKPRLVSLDPVGDRQHIWWESKGCLTKGCLDSTKFPKVGIRKAGIPKVGIPKPGIPRAGIPKLGIPKNGQMKISKTESTPTPWARGLRDQSKNGRSRPRKPFISRVFCAQSLGNGQTMGWG